MSEANEIESISLKLFAGDRVATFRCYANPMDGDPSTTLRMTLLLNADDRLANCESLSELRGSEFSF